MRIVHALTHFDLLTGSGLYVYELARVLTVRGHEVTVVAEHVGGILTARARDAGVEVASVADLPDVTADLLHIHQAAPGAVALDRWPRVPVVATVHSPWPGDDPVDSDRVHTYICVRPEIRSKLIRLDGVPRERTTVLLNGIDRSRFRPAPRRQSADGGLRVLFAATMSPFRLPAVTHMIEHCVRADHDLLLLGLGDPDLLGSLPRNVTWERREVWRVEDYVKECDEVAGTSVGRTAIEGWLCDRPAWVYETVPFEGLESVALCPPPPPTFLDLCDIEYLTDAVELIYSTAAGGTSP